ANIFIRMSATKYSQSLVRKQSLQDEKRVSMQNYIKKSKAHEDTGAKERKQNYRSKRVNKERIFVYIIACLVLLFLLIPIIVIPILSFGASTWLEFPPSEFSFKWYQELFSSSEWLIPIINSLKVAVPVVFLSML